MEKTDSDIVNSYREGEESAFDLLIERYTRRIYAFAYRLSGDQNTAEDVVSETFIKVWKKLDSFDDKQSFASWIFTIARNTTFDMLRKKKDISFSRFLGQNLESDDADMNESVVDDTDLADIQFDKTISQKILLESLERLSFERRSIVLLHDVDGLTFDEIARVVKKPMNTVKSHYRRALIALRFMLEGQDI